MKINKIKLFNFGSYEGETLFDTSGTDNRKIILIGGKNGAGKTTLFTAMRVCLYGFLSMGYKNHNVYYSRAITKLINNSAKLKRPTQAEVELEIQIPNGHELDTYSLKRSWELSDSLLEKFDVIKNGLLLGSEEKADFEKFLFSIIPPELFNFYFFDGEKIADFFLEEGSNARIKNAFLTLCGYDVFDIMAKNFRRVGATNTEANSTFLTEYIRTKEAYETAQNCFLDTKKDLDNCVVDIANADAELVELEKNYAQSGGVTKEQWDEYLAELRVEEKKRESYNLRLKRIANELLPFLIIREQIEAVEEQILSENNNLKYSYFCEVLAQPDIAQAISRLKMSSILPEIKSLAFSRFGSSTESIFDLSFESAASVLAATKDILEFDPKTVGKIKRAIKSSIAKCAKIRKTLDDCNIDSVQAYVEKKNLVLETKMNLMQMRLELEALLRVQESALEEAEREFNKAKAALEDQLKTESITDIASRSILMLDQLQAILYRKQIDKVEAFFREEINALMRKTDFINGISIDDDFNIRIFKNEEFAASQLLAVLTSPQHGGLTEEVYQLIVSAMEKETGDTSISVFATYLRHHKEYSVSVPVEIDKTSLSNGEKQIFIMALYHSLVRLCSHEVPFIIDTPFARIDSEHRQNIAKHFFSQLNGQVFILSTNEEIDSRHIQIMKDKIAATYMLENTDNKRTLVVRNTYFEG